MNRRTFFGLLAVAPLVPLVPAATLRIQGTIDARGASVDLINALPAILKANSDRVEAKIIEGLARNRYKL